MFPFHIKSKACAVQLHNSGVKKRSKKLDSIGSFNVSAKFGRNFGKFVCKQGKNTICKSRRERGVDNLKRRRKNIL